MHFWPIRARAGTFLCYKTTKRHIKDKNCNTVKILRAHMSLHLRNRKHVPCLISIELHKHEWKFGRTRNDVETKAAGKCFHSFFEFSQTFASVSNSIETRSACFVFRLENNATRKRKTTCYLWLSKSKFSLLTPSLRHQRALVVSPSSYTNTIINQSVRAFSFSKWLYKMSRVQHRLTSFTVVTLIWKFLYRWRPKNVFITLKRPSVFTKFYKRF